MLIPALFCILFFGDTIINDGVLLVRQRGGGGKRISRYEAPRLCWAALVFYGAIAITLIVTWAMKR